MFKVNTNIFRSTGRHKFIILMRGKEWKNLSDSITFQMFTYQLSIKHLNIINSCISLKFLIYSIGQCQIILRLTISNNIYLKLIMFVYHASFFNFHSVVCSIAQWSSVLSAFVSICTYLMITFPISSLTL